MSCILHLGSGAKRVLDNELPGDHWKNWREVRVDIEARSRPDILSSFVDLKGKVEDASCDIVWISHAIEHVPHHQVQPAFCEMKRVLRPTGYVLLTCPDLEAVAKKLLEVGSEEPVYHAPAGPISAIDMLYGHRKSIEEGQVHMRHLSGFTAASISALLLAAGFSEVRTTTGKFLDLWVLAFSGRPANTELVTHIAGAEVDFGI